MSTRQRTWEIVEAAKPGDLTSRSFDIGMLVLIFLNVLAAIIGTIPSVDANVGSYLHWFEIFSVGVFSLEYIVRIWSCTADAIYAHPFRGRLKFAFRGLLLIDLMAILPFYLPFFGVDLRSLRVLRLFRILRVAKVGRYYSSLHLIKRVMKSKKEELVLTTALMALLLVIASSILFYCENSRQPAVFSSIPATMWWAIATLTTVGYGDMYPVTVLGKVFGSIIAVLGIGMFALPTGILGSGFVEEIHRVKNNEEVCPHCGEPIR